MKNTVAIIGYGWVGKAMYKLFPDALVYDTNIRVDELGFDTLNPSLEQYRKHSSLCEVAFICVPTPNIGEGKLDTSIVEECIKWCNSNLLVIRSTVNPGDCDRWVDKYKKRIVMQPEYLGETPAHPLLDPKVRPFLILGGHPFDTRKLIDLYTTVYNANITIRQVSLKEAEVIKLTENRAIAFKVAQCQELYDVCEKIDLDYYTIRDAVFGDDPRMNLWFTMIYPDNRGMNSKCIPKDVFAWCAWAESLGYEPKITRALLNKNKEWIKNA